MEKEESVCYYFINMNTRNLMKNFFFLTLMLCCTSVYAQTVKPIVTGIEAKALSTNRITVSWSLPERTEGYFISTLIVYKDTRPIAGKNALDSLKPVATLPGTAVSYSDTVTDFHEYYYAVISLVKPGSSGSNSLYFDEELDTVTSTEPGEINSLLLPGVNTTVEGTRVKSNVNKNVIPSEPTESFKEKLYAKDEMREQPLPFLDILGTANTPAPEISSETEAKALSLVGGKKTHMKNKSLDVYYFEEDLVSPAAGDEYLLFEVLRTTFVKNDFPAAVNSLRKFLAQKRNRETTDRATFYLGEAYYFSGKFMEAINQFVILNEVYPVLSHKWIESALELYEIPE